MSDPKLISPMLDNFIMGDPISEHHGVRCCPAIEKDSDNKYIVKIISTPANESQAEALLLSGAYSEKKAVLSYFKTLSESIIAEASVLQKLSEFGGFLPYETTQLEPMEDDEGYDVYLLSAYKKTLQRILKRSAMTHLSALNLALDLSAALTACRRSGYLYVDLKPSNIYVAPDGSFRIGDIGFLKLDSLKYTSLPDRYRSQYTAPEITDAYSDLNTTLDTYALGLVLYQIFNDGMLPFKEDTAPANEFPPPAYADYEMAEIILKACAPDPVDRWQNPAEIGQAIVNYMQRNGAHDVPIVPAAPVQELTEILPEQATDGSEHTNSESPAVIENSLDGAQELAADEATEYNSTESAFDAESEKEFVDSEVGATDIPEVQEDQIYSEDEEGNLTFLSTSSDDETIPDAEIEDIDYAEVSEEVSDILTQADDLIAHPAPDPVVQPEPIDVPIPPPITDEATDSVSDDTPTDDSENSVPDVPTQEGVQNAEDSEEDLDEDDSEMPRRQTHWLRNTLLVLLALLVAVAGFLFYRYYYLQPIESILLEEGADGVLTVLVQSEISEDKLTVICSDTYGNQLTEPVTNGRAVFTGLAPNSAYTVKVAVSGFHKLTGDTTAAYTTPVQTNIVQFSAVTGTEDGSVVLGFAIDGPDASQWIISYITDDGTEKSQVFSGHIFTINGLTIGNTYAFTLQPNEDLQITGTTQITHTASKVVKARKVLIAGIADGKLNTKWFAPEDTKVENWTVRCYNDSGFDETMSTTETTATFNITDEKSAYTVEVTAAGMSVSERAFAQENAITVKDFSIDTSDMNNMRATWQNVSDIDTDLVLLSCINGSSKQEITCNGTNSMDLGPVIPGSEYEFTLQTSDGTAVLGGSLAYTSADAKNFEGYGVNSEYMEFMMCRTPSYSGWNRYDLSDSDYTTTFDVGEKASFLVRLRHEYDTSYDTIVSLFVIRDENGAVVSASTTSSSWIDMWYRNYCELDIPRLPTTPGRYSITVYFNGAYAGQSNFTIVNE